MIFFILKDRKFPRQNIVHFSGRNPDINLVELGKETVKEDDRAVLFEGGALQSASPKVRNSSATSHIVRLATNEDTESCCT